MKLYINEFQIGNRPDAIKGSEAIIYPFKNFIIKRITPRAIAKEPFERKRLYDLHQFLKNIKHPYIAPVLDIKAKKDEKGNYEYIEIIKPRYNKLNKDESNVMWDFYLTIKEYYNSAFLKKAMDNFIETHEEEYKDNLKGIADATLYLKNKGVIKYLMKHFNEPYFDIHNANVMKKDDGQWVIIDF